MATISLPQRFALALKAFSRPRAALTIPAWQNGQPVYELKTFENYVNQGYKKNELIFACIEAHMDTASAVKLQVYRKGTDDKIEDHPLRKLLERPNPHMSEAQFIALSIAQLKLAGKTYWEKTYNEIGEVVRLWALRPDWVEIVPSAKDWIGAYRYEIPGTVRIDLKPEDVLAMRHFDPLDQYKSVSPVQIAARVGEVDNSTTDYVKLFFERGTQIPGYLKHKAGSLTPKEAADIKRAWVERYSGFNKWFAPAVLDADMDYVQTSSSFKDMAFDVLDARDEARICMVLKVPPMIVGAKMGLERSTFNNSENFMRAWWLNVLKPQYKMLGDALTLGLVDESERDSIEIRADLSDVDALKENIDAIHKRADEGWKSGNMTLDETRKMKGLEELPNGAGKIFLRPDGTLMDESYEPVQDPLAMQGVDPATGLPMQPPQGGGADELAQRRQRLSAPDVAAAARKALFDKYGMVFPPIPPEMEWVVTESEVASA